MSGAHLQEAGAGRIGVKRYRPHILVVIALAIVLSTGWHGSLRNALTDLRFAWQSRDASGKVVVVAIDAPSIDQIGCGPGRAGCTRSCCTGSRPRERGHRLRCRFQHAVGSGVRRGLRQGPSRGRGSTILPSFKQPTPNGGAAHVNRPLKPFANQSWPAVVNVAVESDGLVRRYPFGEKLPAIP